MKENNATKSTIKQVIFNPEADLEVDEYLGRSIKKEYVPDMRFGYRSASLGEGVGAKLALNPEIVSRPSSIVSHYQRTHTNVDTSHISQNIVPGKVEQPINFKKDFSETAAACFCEEEVDTRFDSIEDKHASVIPERAFGVPSIRTDLKVPRTRSCANEQAYGDEPPMKAILQVTSAEDGATMSDRLVVMSPTDLFQMFVTDLEIMSTEEFERFYELAVEYTGSEKVAPQIMMELMKFEKLNQPLIDNHLFRSSTKAR
ncbi:hypothetical protein PCE1_001803 [Barthelona sp. PCE]